VLSAKVGTSTPRSKENQMTTQIAFLTLSASVLTLTLPALGKAAPAEAVTSMAASRRLPQEVNVNLFRNPSIGLEYRLGDFALHAGVYPTIISKDSQGVNETSWFLRAGLTYFLLGHSFYGQRPSEFYLSGSYLRGFNHGHGNVALADVGYRWMVWHGLNLRIGVAVMLERDHTVKVNPTPGIGWSQSF
jgi:hypothetical protein